MELETATDILDGTNPPNPKSAAEYRQAFLNHLKRQKRHEKPQTTTLKVGIDCGRWVTNCKCGGAIAAHPNWQFAACLTCGRSWTSIEFPSAAFLSELEQVFKQRPAGTVSREEKRYWSWWPEAETMDDIKQENTRYGWDTKE